MTQERRVLLDPQRRDLILDRLENRVTKFALSSARKSDPEEIIDFFHSGNGNSSLWRDRANEVF